MSNPSNTALGPAPIAGDTLGPYTLDETLGAGGTATVFRARGPNGRIAAIKTLHPGKVGTEETQRFSREYRALARMDHPNIVRVYESGVTRGFPWIAMEHVEGTDLGTLLENWEKRPPFKRFQKVERLFRGLCRGLQYIHDLGLVHRDFKPSNILVTEDCDPKISDFGVVKESAGVSDLTMAGKLVGTVAFMAPEQITGDTIDSRADLYALGAVLYMMLTFKRPIEASSVVGYLARHLKDVPTPPGEVDPQVPPVLERICQRLLSKEPASRYPSAQAALLALDHTDLLKRPTVRGRDEQLHAWSARLQTLQNGGGGLVALVAPTGAGKSLILHNFAERASNLGIGVAMSSGGTGPLLSGLLEDLPEMTSPNIQLGASVLDKLAARIASRPWVLAVDNLDEARADEVLGLTKLLVDHVGREGAPWLLLFTASQITPEVQSLLDGASAGLPVDRLELAPLQKRQVLGLMRDQGLTGATAAIVGRRLFKEIGGNPGNLTEQIDALTQQGWLKREGRALYAQRSLVALRSDPLPVPRRIQTQLTEELQHLDDSALELVRLLALLGRPAPLGLLAGLLTEAASLEARVDELVQRALIHRSGSGPDETLTLHSPGAPAVIGAALDPDVRRGLHRRIADVLAQRHRRRRSTVAGEIAHHLLHADQPSEAYPMLLLAIRHAARSQDHREVLEIGERALQAREAAEPTLSTEEVGRSRRWLHHLLGESMLFRGEWDTAAVHLEQAVEAARGLSDRPALAQSLGALGRARHRQGRFEEAASLLEEALRGLDPSSPSRAAATRSFADILLRRQDLEGSEQLWSEALDIGQRLRSTDAEARARRGLANVRALQNRLQEASDLIDRAEQLLIPHGDVRVLASVLARGAELDIAAGRYGSASRRTQSLVEACVDEGMADRLPEAHALRAEVLLRVGMSSEAAASARSAIAFAHPQPTVNWDPLLRAAETLGRAGDPQEAEEALPSPEDLPGLGLEDPPARLAAVRAYLLAAQRRPSARDLALWALTRPNVPLGFRFARMTLLCTQSLLITRDHEGARRAAKRGLQALRGPGSDGLRLELLLSLNHAHPDARVADAARQIAQRIQERLDPELGQLFANRAEIDRVLSGPRGA